MPGLAALARGRPRMDCAASWPFQRMAPARGWPLALAGTLVDPTGSSIRLPSPRARRACHPVDQWLRRHEGGEAADSVSMTLRPSAAFRCRAGTCPEISAATQPNPLAAAPIERVETH